MELRNMFFVWFNFFLLIQTLMVYWWVVSLTMLGPHNYWEQWIHLYDCYFRCNVVRCSFRSSSEQLQDQFSHRDSDWNGGFCTDSLSLCETQLPPLWITLTVIMSSIFSLDSTDGQSEITVRSTATESRWSSWLEAVCQINQEFRSFSRFL